MRKRTKANEGSLVQGPKGKGSFRERPHTRKDGSQCIRWSGYLPAHGKKFWGSGKKYHEAVAQAEAKIAKYEEQNKDQRPVAQVTAKLTVPTLAGFIHEFHFKSLRKNRRADSTMRRYEDMARHICSFVPEEGGTPLGERPISDVDYGLLEEFMDTFINRDRKVESDGDSYAADVRTFLIAVYRRAFNYRFADRNFAENLTTIRRPSKQPLDVKDCDIEKIYQATNKASIHAFVLLAYQGMAISEILGLCADQIEGNQIHVTRQVTRIKNPIFDKSKPSHPRSNPVQICALTHKLKRRGRKRTIYLTDETMKIVMASLESAKLVRAQCDGQVIEVQPVIPSRDGGIWQAHHFRATWNKLCKKTGVTMRIHDFRALLTRDEYASGTVLFELSQQLGHADIQTTEQSYLRLARSDMPNLGVSIKRANRFIEQVASGSGELV